MKDLEPIRIYARARYKLLVGGIVLFIASGVLAVGYSVFSVRVIGVIGIIFFGFALCNIVWRVLLTPALVIDKEGIIDNASGTAVGRIPWANIAEVVIVPFMGQSYVGIVPIDSKRTFGSCGFLARIAIRDRERKGVPPVIIPASILGLDSTQLMNNIKLYQSCSKP